MKRQELLAQQVQGDLRMALNRSTELLRQAMRQCSMWQQMTADREAEVRELKAQIAELKKPRKPYDDLISRGVEAALNPVTRRPGRKRKAPA